MRTAPPAPAGPAGGPLLNFFRAWNGFWFSPADPTPLGFIRVCAGLVIFYVYLAYCFDLQQFVGPHAWGDLAAINEYRSPDYGIPWATRAPDWSDMGPPPQVGPLQSRNDAERDLLADEIKRRASGWLTEMDADHDGRISNDEARGVLAERFGLFDTNHNGFLDESELKAASLEEQRRYEESYIQTWGINPRLVYARGSLGWSVWFAVTDPNWAPVVQAVMLVIVFLFVIGFCTRVTSVLTWLVSMSFVQRSPVTLFGMDTIITILLTYLMIGPSGAALSVDRLIARKRAGQRLPKEFWHLLGIAGAVVLALVLSTRFGKFRMWFRFLVVAAGALAAGIRVAIRPRLPAVRRAGSIGAQPKAYRAEPEFARPAPSVSANLALRLMQVHISIIYLASGLSKLMGPAWWRGTALWGTMANPEFSPIHFELYMQAMRYLTGHRWLWETFMSGGVIFTLVFEIGFAFLIWYRPLRWVMLVSAVLLHTGIAVFMGLNTFSLCMLTLVMAFVPAEAFHQLLRAVGLENPGAPGASASFRPAVNAQAERPFPAVAGKGEAVRN